MKNSLELKINCAVCRKKLSRKNAVVWPMNRAYPTDNSYLCSKKCKKFFKKARGPIERRSYYLHLSPGCAYSKKNEECDMEAVVFNSK